MYRLLLLFGALSGLLCVVLGAFGAHGLEGVFNEHQFSLWGKAVDYQAVHSLALIATGLFGLLRPAKTVQLAGWLFLAGILLFSGSLYLLALSGVRLLGLVTPFGGTAFIAGWFCLALAAWRLPRD